MAVEQRTAWFAGDGTPFPTREQAVAYEERAGLIFWLLSLKNSDELSLIRRLLSENQAVQLAAALQHSWAMIRRTDSNRKPL